MKRNSNTPKPLQEKQVLAGKYIKDLIIQSAIPRNQIATLSGLSNPYIRELEKGSIKNVAREKLISLAVALNLDLEKIDELMTVFDRAILNNDDIPIFVEVSRKIQFSKAMHPVYDSYSMDLVLLSSERTQGDYYIVSTKPAASLRSSGHNRYLARKLLTLHPLYAVLLDAMMAERKKVVLENLKKYKFTQFVCLRCLMEYIENCHDSTELDMRYIHVANVIHLLRQEPNFSFFLLDQCPGFIFTLKTMEPKEEANDRLVLDSYPPHRHLNKASNSLTGFATNNPVVIANFKRQMEMLKGSIVEELKDKKALISFLENLIQG